MKDRLFTERTMPVFYRIDRSLGVVFHRFEGRVTDAEPLGTTRGISEDPDFKSGMNGIVDLSGVTSDTGVSYQGLETLRDHNHSLPEEMNYPRLATFAPTDVSYGLSRAFATLSEGRDADGQVFRSMDEACDWLGIGTEGWDVAQGWVEVNIPDESEVGR